MEFHGFHAVGYGKKAKHYMTITDNGKRQRVEVTAEERESIERSRGRAYQYWVQCGYRGHNHYSTPFQWGLMGEAWARGVEEGVRRKERDRC